MKITKLNIAVNGKELEAKHTMAESKDYKIDDILLAMDAALKSFCEFLNNTDSNPAVEGRREPTITEKKG